MRILECKCKRCGRKYEFEDGGENGYATDICGPYCDGYLAGERAERERCAKVAETMFNDWSASYSETGRAIAIRIRKGPQ